MNEEEDGCGIRDHFLVPPLRCFDCLSSSASDASEWLSQLHHDVEVMVPREGNRQSLSLMSLLDRTTLRGSSRFLASLVGSVPLSDVALLKRRQKGLKELETLGIIGEDEQRLRELEPDILWFFHHERDDTLRLLTDSVYYGSWPLSILNTRSPFALSVLHAYNGWAPWMSALSPIVYLVIPYLVMRWKGFIKMGFLRYLWTMVKSTVSQALCIGQEGVTMFARAGSALRGLSALASTGVFFYSIVSGFELSRAFEKIGGTVGKRVEGAMEFLKLARGRRERFGGPVAEWFAGRREEQEQEQEKNIPPVVHHFLRRGRQLVDAKRFDHSNAVNELAASYALDALVSILKSRRELKFCWAEYSDEDRPSIDLRGVRHPFLSAPVANDWSLGAAHEAPNVLLTGPNAGGKSTLMKSVLAAVILSQTVTIAPCESVKLTPFSTIASHLSAVDMAGSASTFETEMMRAQKVLRCLCVGGPQKSLVVLDEIFNSTNPIEGIAAATSVARHLARNENVMAIISTHYVHIGKLAGDRYVRFQMPVVKKTKTKTKEDIIAYPYKLRRGVCRQLIALDLMKRAGFDASVVDEALEVVRQLTTPPTTPCKDQSINR